MQFTFVYIATCALHFFNIFNIFERNNIVYESLIIKYIFFSNEVCEVSKKKMR